MTPLLLLLTLGWGATGGDPPGVAGPVSALEALLSSGSGSLPRGAVESLVGIAAGRAQCRAGPCGKCPSAGAVLALAGKAGAAARLEAADLPWLGAAVLATLRDPDAACADAALGRWAARARALHRAFTADADGRADADADGNANSNANANANSNTNANTSTNANVNANANTSVNANTNTSTNANVNANANTNTNANTNASANTNINANANANANTSTDANANVNANASSIAAGSGGPGLWQVTELLAAVQPNYRSADSRQGCVDAAGVLAAGRSASPRVGARPGERVLAVLGALVLRGRCLRPTDPPGFFLDYLVLRFGRGPHGLSTLMEQLGLGPGEQQHPPGPPRGDPPHGDPPRGDGDGDGDGRPDALPHTRIQSQPWDTVCLSPPELLGALGLPGGVPLSRGDFLRLAPALLQQQLSRACAPRHPPAPRHPDAHRRHRPTAPGTAAPTATAPTGPTGPTSPTATGQLSTLERYLLATATGVGLCLCPLVALALLRCPLCRGAQRWLRPLLLGLAAGALSGDALLHLLPQLLGSHAHAEGDHGHAGEGGGPAEGPPWKLLGVPGGLYAAFLLEKLLGILLRRGDEGGPRCDHGAGQQPEASSAELVKVEDADLPQSPPDPQSRGGWALPCMVTAGDASHSLTDGLALGAAFAASRQSGLATGLALLCHELPHALGALGVLAQAGLSGRRVLALGLGGALPVLPGLYAGLALGAADAARAWLTALAAGLLLHLALCDMVPAMLAARDPRPWLVLGLQSAGLLGGWGILLLLALYEESVFH